EQAPETGLQLDLKWHGYEEPVVEALRRHGLVERAFVSSFHPHSLRTVGLLEPALTRGLTYPYDRRGVSGRRLLAPVVVGTLVGLRRALPLRIGRLLERAGASVAVLHHMVISRGVVARCHARGVPVVAWTVDSPAVMRHLVAAGVDAIVTNNPSIFG